MKSSRSTALFAVALTASVLASGTGATTWAQVPPDAPVVQVPPPPAPAPPLIAAPIPDPRLDEARREYDATNYEVARDLLDVLIMRVTETGVSDPSQRAMLAAAYELRGRARLNLRDIEAARADFRALLLIEPTHVLPVQAGPRAEALFDEVRRATLGQVDVAVVPADAEVTLDGVRLAERPPTLTLVAGTHTLSASRRGHRTASQTFTIVPGAPPQAISLVLEREFSTLMLTTMPPAVEVVVDDVPRGKTEAEPPGSLAGGGGARSQTLIIEGLNSGRHRLEFRRECFITAERTLDLVKPDDIVLEPVRLEPAVATVSVTSDRPGTVFVDDRPRGQAPQVIGDLCRGRHTVEVRSATGRDLRRLDVAPGQKIDFIAMVRPAFALVSESGEVEASDGASSKLVAETAFQPTRRIMLFAAPEARTAEVLATNRVPGDWLAFDTLRRPLGGAGTVNETTRRELGARLTKAFESQGVAAVTRDPAGDKTDMLLTLLAPGSARPDVVRWKLDTPASIAQAVSRLDEVPPLTQASIGMLGVDVLDVAGVVVASTDPGGSAAAAGVQTGEIVVQVDGRPVTNAAELRAVVDAATAGQTLALDVRGRDGVDRRTMMMVQRVPRLIEPQDQTVLSNTLAVAYTHMAAAPASPLDDVAIRLNLATAWMRLENWSAATRELDRVVAVASGSALGPAVRDAVAGTAQYLQAACAEAAGDLANAERLLNLAAASKSALLTDGGEPIRDLSERRLAQIRKAKGAN